MFVLLTASNAEAGFGGGLTLKLDTQYERSDDASIAHDSRGTQLVGLSLDAYGGGEYGGAAIHIDAHFGAGLTGGFAYKFDFQPFGLALYHAKQGAIVLGLTTGIRLQGVTGHQDFGSAVPVRLFLNFKIQPWFHINTWAAIDTSLNESRDRGSQHALWADELRAGLAIRIGPNRTKKMRRGQVSSGSGYFVGTTYSERLGISFWGITVGHGMDMAAGKH